jgi:hypothetical protein
MSAGADKTASALSIKIKTIYEITNIRNSTGENRFTKGDVIKTVNGMKAYKYPCKKIKSLTVNRCKWIT